ncbi:hypothetical protein NDU88_008373, partial [Pleurodeles waltl]
CPVGFAMQTLQCLQMFPCTAFQVPCGVCYAHSPMPADVLMHRLSGALWGLLCTLSSASRCSPTQAFRWPVRLVIHTLQCLQMFSCTGFE